MSEDSTRFGGPQLVATVRRSATQNARREGVRIEGVPVGERLDACGKRR